MVLVLCNCAAVLDCADGYQKESQEEINGAKKSDGKESEVKQSVQKHRTPKKLAKRKATSRTATARKKSSMNTERQRRDPSALSKGSSGLQSGDLPGLFNIGSADSESVDELLEEGNAFEAGIVSGVEESRGRGGKEVRTREVSENDVPGEYLDEK